MDLETYTDHLVGFTPEQQTALVRIYSRHVKHTDHRDFVGIEFTDWLQRHVTELWFDDSVMAAVPNMTIGIEPDGYAHT